MAASAFIISVFGVAAVARVHHHAHAAADLHVLARDQHRLVHGLAHFFQHRRGTGVVGLVGQQQTNSSPPKRPTVSSRAQAAACGRPPPSAVRRRRCGQGRR
jgi:hypothetical protein